MIGKSLIGAAFLMIPLSLSAQKEYSTYFKEIKLETKKNQWLWNKDIYGPMLLVNPETRQLFANYPDSLGILQKSDDIYSGTLPIEINMANTAMQWNGRNWAMIMLPLPVDKYARATLLSHELFHAAQPSLGFLLYNASNNHLDKQNGRVFLRLELAALIKAIQEKEPARRKTYLQHAITFRTARHTQYPGADTTENSLELNEGLAEYTGRMMSGRDQEQAVAHFVKSCNTFLKNPSYVRSFAYQTIPLYGYMLNDVKKNWVREINVKTNLTQYLMKKFALSSPVDPGVESEKYLTEYDGTTIIAEEKVRQEKLNVLIADYSNKLINQPHFELALVKMSVSFDPRNVIPIDDKGTVYPYIRVTDDWGILTAEEGALISPSWNKLTVTIPLKFEDKRISGKGWVLELKDGYTVIKEDATGNYLLKKL